MKKFSVALLALTAVLAFSPLAKADTITITAGSSLGISVGNDSWSATQVTFPTLSGAVLDNSGVFSVVPLYSAVTMNTSNLVYATPDELIFTTSLGVATFTITGPITVSLSNSQYLNMSGNGVLTLTGYLPTVGIFSASSTDSNLNFGGSGSSQFGIDITSTGQYAPEPGTLTLFGTGLLGLAGMLRFKFARKSR
jgi:hypothetical protein